MWCHLSTGIGLIRSLRFVVPTLLLAAVATMLFIADTTSAAPGINKTLSFQGRLQTSTGAVVPDGHYNFQFKIYQDGAGTAAGNPGGSLRWTETYVNNGGDNGVEVRNGYFSVNLGSITPFGTSIDWNQDTLFLSMNVAGSSATCSAFGTSPCAGDGEMLPMKRITATPFALHADNANKIGGLTTDNLIQNSTSPQTADFNISGTGLANTFQGNTSVIAPLFDRSDAGTLDIGTANATTINIGTSTGGHEINIGTGNGTGDQKVTIGSKAQSSSTVIQGGGQGVRIESGGGFAVHTNYTNRDSLLVDSYGNINFQLASLNTIDVVNSNAQNLFHINDSGAIRTGYGTEFVARGTANFEQGITIQGTGSNKYYTPNGYEMSTAINIPNYNVGAYGTVLAFGLPSTSAATARGLLVADARTTAHQATIGVLSPDENNIMGFSWNGSTTTGYLSNSANSLALQGNGLDLLTATNNGGQANVGIGNNASSGYALDVTGDTNTSAQYRIGGNVALTENSLNFSGASPSNISSAGGQSLNLNSDTGVSVQVDGKTSATFNENTVQIGDGATNGAPTLLTLDGSASAPSTELLGSMYYDTTVGKVQCYEADGWGTCGASPDSFVTLSPEYSNSVTHGDGVGTMTSDLCSDMLNINDGSSSQPTICGTNETNNFYKWTSPESTNQTRSIFVTYQLPTSFKEFVPGSSSLMGRTNSSDSNVTYQVYRNNDSGLTACGAVVTVSTGSQSTWQKVAAAGGNDPSACDFAAGDSIVFRVNLTARNDANAYVGNLGFAFSNK